MYYSFRIMRRLKGLRIGSKVVKLWKWLLKPRKKCSTAGYLRLTGEDRTRSGTVTGKICDWGRCLTRRLRLPLQSQVLCYDRVGQSPLDNPKPVSIPKGHLAVYVGQKDADPHRFLVPVIYFNHPLFGELLRDSEKEYGFDHPGGITIPCPISDFKSVQMKIAAGEGGRNVIRRRHLLLDDF